MVEKQLSVFLENKPGVLAEVCRTLAEQGVNIRGMSISDTVDHAVVRLIVNDPQKAIHVLGEHGALVVETEVLAVKLDDKPGRLAELAEKFAQAEVNIEYAYGSSNDTHATVFFRVSDVQKAIAVLAPKKPAKKKAPGKGK
jgi:hypothetical protein